MNDRSIHIEPVGYVRTALPDDQIGRNRASMIVDIDIEPRYAEALLGIEDYSHVFVIFWMHKVDRSTFRSEVHPRGNPDLPLMGALATRGRHHPNPLGLAVCELVERRSNRLTVKRLDAVDGTPVIDIKPYDNYDAFDPVRVPSWWPRRRVTK